ncbi:MAG: hypothetical protein U0325_30565 [Polyangiales bacterium]
MTGDLEFIHNAPQLRLAPRASRVRRVSRWCAIALAKAIRPRVSSDRFAAPMRVMSSRQDPLCERAVRPSAARLEGALRRVRNPSDEQPVDCRHPVSRAQANACCTDATVSARRMGDDSRVAARPMRVCLVAKGAATQRVRSWPTKVQPVAIAADQGVGRERPSEAMPARGPKKRRMVRRRRRVRRAQPRKRSWPTTLEESACG